jgi:16S rRNA (cytidine1402-2'-O)-methyltransferase
MFEKVERGTLSSLLAFVQQSKLRGEYVIVIAGTGKNVKPLEDA